MNFTSTPSTRLWNVLLGKVCHYLMYIQTVICGPDSSVGIATDYVLDGPG